MAKAAVATGRERFIPIAAEIFARRGFGLVALDEVIGTVGVTKTTFYKHFESKDDLMVAAVQRRHEWETEAWGRAVHRLAGDDPIKQLLAMIDVLDIWFNDPDFYGCMFLNAATEFPNPNDPVHQAAAVHLQQLHAHRATLALAAGADPTAAASFADCYTALVEGAMVLRQTQGRNDAARVIRPAIEQLINAYLPSSEPRR